MHLTKIHAMVLSNDLEGQEQRERMALAQPFPSWSFLPGPIDERSRWSVVQRTDTEFLSPTPRHWWQLSLQQTNLPNSTQYFRLENQEQAQASLKVQTMRTVRVAIWMFSLGCQHTDEVSQELKAGRTISSFEANTWPLLLSDLTKPILQHLTLFWTRSWTCPSVHVQQHRKSSSKKVVELNLVSNHKCRTIGNGLRFSRCNCLAKRRGHSKMPTKFLRWY